MDTLCGREASMSARDSRIRKVKAMLPALRALYDPDYTQGGSEISSAVAGFCTDKTLSMLPAVIKAGRSIG